jgi:hypothetical protein
MAVPGSQQLLLACLRGGIKEIEGIEAGKKLSSNTGFRRHAPVTEAVPQPVLGTRV